jgi:hypothetical protein
LRGLLANTNGELLRTSFFVSRKTNFHSTT